MKKILRTKTDITLREGLANFYENYTSQLSHTKAGLPDNVRQFFKSHDIAHVLFGCDISLYGEGSVKIWSIFGTSLGFWRHLKEYRKANAFELAQSFSCSHVIKHLFPLILETPGLIYRSKKMIKPWPWDNFEPYLDRPIDEIRTEFNIHILQHGI